MIDLLPNEIKIGLWLVAMQLIYLQKCCKYLKFGRSPPQKKKKKNLACIRP